MKTKTKSMSSWWHNSSFRVFLLTVCLLSFCSAPALAVKADIGGITINGQTKITMGWMKMGETNPIEFPEVDNLETEVFDEARKHGYDFVMQYGVFRNDANGTLTNAPNVVAWMDYAESKGVGVMIDVHNPKDANVLTAWVAAVKDHNALYGYYMEDEPAARYYTSGVNSVAPNVIIALYDALRAEDPDMNHPTCIAFGYDISNPNVANYFPACEIVSGEIYPTWWNDGTFPSKFTQIPTDISVAEANGLGVLFTTRFWDTDDHLAPMSPYLNRYMIFAPISMGSGGIMPHIYEGWMPPNPNEPPAGFRDAMAYPVTDDLREVIDILGVGDFNATSAGADADITWVCGGDADEAVLIAVNNSGSSAKSSVDFTLDSLSGSNLTATVLWEDRTVTANGSGYFTDDFDPYEVHVYHFGPVDTDTAFEIKIDHCVYSYKAASTTNYYNPGGTDDLIVGNLHGINQQIYPGYMQLDMSSLDINDVLGDGTFTFYARIKSGHAEQTGGFHLRELGTDYVKDEVCWDNYSTGNAWADSGATYWDYGGCGDPNTLLDAFTVTTGSYVLKSVTIPEATIQGWVDSDETVSLLFAVNKGYYWSFFANKLIEVGGDGSGSPGVPTLTFNANLAGTMPSAATSPTPSDAANNVDVSATTSLSWTAGAYATSHDVYFDSNQTAVTNATQASDEFKINAFGSTSYDLESTLDFNTTYYWAIDEVGTNGTTAGSVWSFTTEVLTDISLDVNRLVYSYKAAPTTNYYNSGGTDDLPVGNNHGILDQLFAGYLQFDLSSVSGDTIDGDGKLSFYARMTAGHTEQTGGFQVRSLDTQIVYDEVDWEDAYDGNSWTDTTAAYWDYGGCGDTDGLVGSFTVTDHNYVLKELTVPEATIQGWIDDANTVSLLFAVHTDYYGAYYAYRRIEIGGEGGGTPGIPTLTFSIEP